jgi:hypothetical protein
MKDVISLGIGEPDFVTPEPVLESGVASLRRGETHYTSNSGIGELREALCRHLARRYGVNYNPADEILITVGVSEALYLALVAVLDAGDEVIVPQPCFVAYGPEVTLAGGVPRYLATRVENAFQVTAEISSAPAPRTRVRLLLPIIPQPMSRRLQVAELAGGATCWSSRTRSMTAGRRGAYASHPHMRERTITLVISAGAATGGASGCGGAGELLAAMRKVHQYDHAGATAQVAVPRIWANPSSRKDSSTTAAPIDRAPIAWIDCSSRAGARAPSIARSMDDMHVESYCRRNAAAVPAPHSAQRAASSAILRHSLRTNRRSAQSNGALSAPSRIVVIVEGAMSYRLKSALLGVAILVLLGCNLGTPSAPAATPGTSSIIQNTPRPRTAGEVPYPAVVEIIVIDRDGNSAWRGSGSYLLRASLTNAQLPPELSGGCGS